MLRNVFRSTARLIATFVFVVALLSLVPHSAVGQVDTQFGARVGVASTTLRSSDTCIGCSGNRRRGLVAGGYVRFDFSGPLALQPELLYVQKGTRSAQRRVHRKIDYLEVPVLARLQIPVASSSFAPAVFAGPVAGVRMSSDVGQPLIAIVPPSARRTEVGLAAGLGTDLRLDLGTLSVDVRYEYGLTEAIRDPLSNDGPRNHGVVVTGGIAF